MQAEEPVNYDVRRQHLNDKSYGHTNNGIIVSRRTLSARRRTCNFVSECKPPERNEKVLQISPDMLVKEPTAHGTHPVNTNVIASSSSFIQ